MTERNKAVGPGARRTRADSTGRTPSPPGMGLRLELFVEDTQMSIGFYTRVLGFEVVRNEPGDYASLTNGAVVLGIGPISKLPEEGGYFTRQIARLRRGLGVEIVLEVDDVDE